MNEIMRDSFNFATSHVQAMNSHNAHSILVNVRVVPPLKPDAYEKLKKELNCRGISLQVE